MNITQYILETSRVYYVNITKIYHRRHHRTLHVYFVNITYMLFEHHMYMR